MVGACQFGTAWAGLRLNSSIHSNSFIHSGFEGVLGRVTGFFCAFPPLSVERASASIRSHIHHSTTRIRSTGVRIAPPSEVGKALSYSHAQLGEINTRRCVPECTWHVQKVGGEEDSRSFVT